MFDLSTHTALRVRFNILQFLAEPVKIEQREEIIIVNVVCVVSWLPMSCLNYCCSMQGPAVTFQVHSNALNITTADVAKAAGKNSYFLVLPFVHLPLNLDRQSQTMRIPPFARRSTFNEIDVGRGGCPNEKFKCNISHPLKIVCHFLVCKRTELNGE